jgi:hypothetical protein
VSEQAWLTLLTAAIGLLGVIISLFARTVLAAVAQNTKDVASLKAFEARFIATEQAWNLWRETYVGDTGLRRREVDKRLDTHAAEIKDQESRIVRLERNGG